MLSSFPMISHISMFSTCKGSFTKFCEQGDLSNGTLLHMKTVLSKLYPIQCGSLISNLAHEECGEDGR